MGLLKRWPTITGACAVGESSIVSALDWSGRIDFARSHLGDFGSGSAAVISFAVNPPPWMPVLTAVLGLFLIWWDVRRPRIRSRTAARGGRHLNPYLVVAVVSAFVCIGSLTGFVIDRSRGPIRWEIDNKYSPLGGLLRSGEPLCIVSFQFKGENVSSNPVVPIAAYIESNVTPRRVDLGGLRSGQITDLSKVMIAGNSEFSLNAYVPSLSNDRQGMSEEQFRSEFGSFTFHFLSTNYSFEMTYDKQRVNELLNAISEEMKEAQKQSLKMMGPDGIVMKP